MKNILLATLILMCGLTARGQDLNSFKDSLSLPDTLLGSRALVVEHQGLDSLLTNLSNSAQVEEVNGFRVRIFIDNSQSARSRAEAVRRLFSAEFPEVCTFLNYKSPDFTVTVGSFSTIEEATILWGRINRSFNRALIIRERIEIRDLYEKPEQEVKVEETEEEIVIEPVIEE